MSEDKPLPVESELPPVPVEVEKEWAVLEERSNSVRIKAGLRYWLDGYGWRSAAKAAGLDDHQALVNYAKKFGLYAAACRTGRLLEQSRSIVHETNAVVLERLRKDPDAISFRDLTVAAGVHTDKIFASEKHEAGSGLVEALAALAGSLQAGEKLSLSVEKRTVDPLESPDPDAVIDVEPA